MGPICKYLKNIYILGIIEIHSLAEYQNQIYQKKEELNLKNLKTKTFNFLFEKDTISKGYKVSIVSYHENISFYFDL